MNKQLNSIVKIENGVELYNKIFDNMEEYYSSIDKNLIETFKRLGYGIIILKQNKNETEFVIKQLSWNITDEESLETVKNVFKTFEPEIVDNMEGLDLNTYCERLNKDIYKITITNKCYDESYNENIIDKDYIFNPYLF